MNGPDLLNLLRSGDIDPLHAHLSDLQAQFEVGTLHERDLLRAFQPFQTSDLTLSDGFQKWTETHPGTYAPHVALAGWFLGRGWEARGGHTSNRVSDQGWRSLDHFLTQTDGCARHAATLTDNPLAAWNVIGLASNTRGCQLSLHDVQTQQYPDWFTRGVADNPGSFALRRVMLLHLRAEWGGSEEHMLTFVRQQQDAGQLGQTDMQRLWAEFHSHVAHHAQHFAQDHALAVERARIAAELHPLEAEQLLIALTGANASPSERLDALRRYLAAAQQENSVPSGNFGWAVLKAEDWIKPELPRITALLARAAQDGDADSAVLLGHMQLLHPAWGTQSARAVLEIARDQGHTAAAETLAYLSEHTSAPVEQRREDILKAADLFSGEMSWHVYQQFPDFQRQFNLEPRQRFKYLHRAADGGENDARFELARQLRAGRVEVGEDGVLRPVDTAPIQGSLDYAKHLLERAASTDHKGAAKMLRGARDQDWQAATARRLKLTGEQTTKKSGGFWQDWWKWMLAVAVIRLIAALLGYH
ncbi:hypothetical protein [Deinococcus sp.]|uniref:hypothetical protein n=1 Tax=Deinococcus sp. TaxID=47478 RepID=UPI00391C6F9D